MKVKTLAWILTALAVIAASAAAVVVSIQRGTIARAQAASAASREAAADAEKKRVAKEAEKEADKRRAAEANQKAKADEAKAAQLAKEKAALDAQAAADARKTAEAAAAQAQSEAETARAKREAAQAKEREARAAAEKARAEAEAAAEKREQEASRLATEKLKADKIIAEAKALELRKIDFETLERDLTEWKLDLEERERALKPEKTIADLAWAGGVEDSVIDAEGNVKKVVKEPYDPEKDMTLTVATRQLARQNRLRRERFETEADKSKARAVASLEKLYVSALRTGDTVGSDFYLKSIKSMYPDWEFKGEESKKEESKGK